MKCFIRKVWYIAMMSTEHKYPDDKGDLPLGSKAPKINAKDTEGNKITLNKILDNHKGLLIDFFRGAWWGHCKDHSNLLNEHIEDFRKRNVKLISISTDSVNHSKEFKEENDLQMSIVSDRGAKIGKRYDVNIFDTGAGKDIKFKQEIPSKYLIDKSGNIVWKYIGKDKYDRPSIEKILSAIDKNL